MKCNTKSLILGLCFALSITAATIPAEAALRNTTGFASSRALNPNQQTCLLEDNGAVYNSCKSTVNLVFDLPIENEGDHGMIVIDYWKSFNGSFQCVPYAYNPMGGGSPGTGVTFTGASQYMYPDVSNQNNGWIESIGLICWNVPQGAGIAEVIWTY